LLRLLSRLFGLAWFGSFSRQNILKGDNDSQYNDIKYKDTQHNGINCDTQHKWQSVI